MKPNSNNYNPSPDYLYELIQESGLSINKAAQALGHSHRTMRYWLAGKHKFPYTVQYTMEALAKADPPLSDQ